MTLIINKLSTWLTLAVWLAFIGLTLSLPAITIDAQPKPHIILIVADDLGWNDVSWHNPQAKTPHLEDLAKSGVLLNQSYVQPICTPTRSALLTGRYPYSLGRQHDVLWPEEPTGLSIKRQLLPQALKAAGYSTHMVGKWHLGFCSWDYTPTNRGFDTFWGYYTGAEDYYAHTRTTWGPGRGDWIQDDNYPDVYQNALTDAEIKFGYDFRNNTKAAYEADGTYSSYLFSSYVENLLGTRNESDPLFLYLPFQSVHSPLQVPDNYTVPFAHIQDKDRRTKFGMIFALDEAVGRVVDALKKTGHYNNSVIVFTTDNGGPTITAGNNWPLRGNKTTLWEGGTRGAAFVHSPLLPQNGIVSNKLIHVTDWFSTLAGLGGGIAPADTDGYDQWEAITTAAPSPRKEMIYNIDIVSNETNAGVRYGYYKLLIGNPGPGEWTPPPEGVHTTAQQNSEEEDVLNINNDSAKEHQVQEIDEEKQNLQVSVLNNFLHAKAVQSGPFVMTAQLDSEEQESNEDNDDIYIMMDNEEGIIETGDNDLQVEDDDQHELLDSSEEDIFEELEETLLDTIKSILAEEDTPLDNEKESEMYDQELNSLLINDHKSPNDEKRELVTLEDLGIDLEKYSNLGQLLTKKTVVQLFNIEDDPEEREEQSQANPDLVEVLLGVLSQHMPDYVEADILPNDHQANPAFWNNTWTPGWCTAK